LINVGQNTARVLGTGLGIISALIPSINGNCVTHTLVNLISSESPDYCTELATSIIALQVQLDQLTTNITDLYHQLRALEHCIQVPQPAGCPPLDEVARRYADLAQLIHVLEDLSRSIESALVELEEEYEQAVREGRCP